MIDLHIHTTNSDGSNTVEEILEYAEKIGITTLSFCDHNNVGAYKELENIDVSKIYTGKIIPGIEFDFVHDKKNFHLLGYNFDVNKLKKSKYIREKDEEKLLEKEKERLIFFKSVCKKLGIKLSPNLEVVKTTEPANDIIKADMKKHKENDKILDELLGEGHTGSFWLGHVTNPNSPFYIDFTEGLPTVKELADEIHNAGGIVVLPHVFEYRSVDNKEFLQEIYDMGILDGIECSHTKHNEEHLKYLEEFCKKHNLLMSGGSDYHTDERYKLGHTQLGEISEEYCLKYKK